tara:strand:+ start:478 stop:762 length:285 start_codon:yes stop_codon:yes gene_type:complete
MYVYEIDIRNDKDIGNSNCTILTTDLTDKFRLRNFTIDGNQTFFDLKDAIFDFYDFDDSQNHNFSSDVDISDDGKKLFDIINDGECITIYLNFL